MKPMQWIVTTGVVIGISLIGATQAAAIGWSGSWFRNPTAPPTQKELQQKMQEQSDRGFQRQVFSVTSYPSNPCGDNVSDVSTFITDVNLRTDIQKALKMSSIPPNIANEVESFTIFNVGNYPNTPITITSLEGIQCFPNLQALIIVGHAISDLTPLSSLSKLTELNLSDNWISSIAPLAKLNKLQKIDLDNINYKQGGLSKEQNSISDLSPLSGKKKLNYISLHYCPNVS